MELKDKPASQWDYGSDRSEGSALGKPAYHQEEKGKNRNGIPPVLCLKF